MAAFSGTSTPASVKYFYKEAQDNTPYQLFEGRGNLYGFNVDNNDTASDIFVRFYDSDSAPTVASATPTAVYRVIAGASLGESGDSPPLSWFKDGCWVAITGARTGDTAPATDGSFIMWFTHRR